MDCQYRPGCFVCGTIAVPKIEVDSICCIGVLGIVRCWLASGPICLVCLWMRTLLKEPLTPPARPSVVRGCGHGHVIMGL